GLIFLITCFRYYRYLSYPIDNINEWALVFQKQVVTRLDSLAYGVIGAYIKYYYKELWQKYRKASLYIGITLIIITTIVYANYLIPFKSLFYTVFKFSLTSFATLLLLPFLSTFHVRSGF